MDEGETLMATGRSTVKGRKCDDPQPDDLKKLFDARAELVEKDPSSARRLFLQFDAWCEPESRKWLECDSNVRRLSAKAKKLFARKRPVIKDGAMQCAFDLLTYVP